MVGFGFIILSLTALISWKTGYSICNKEICNQIAIGFLDRPWILWGAVFYALSGILTTRLKKAFWVAVVLGTGIVFHGLLLFYGYQISKAICIKCLLFFLASTILTVFYINKDINLPGQWFLTGLGNALLVASLFMLVLHVNPREPFRDEVIIAHAIPSSKTDNIVTPVNTIKLETTPNTTVKNHAANNNSFGPIIRVTNKYNEAVEINIKEKPALLFAWWCPHCDFALQKVSKYNSIDRPYLVACYNDGDQRNYIEKKLAKAGLRDTEYFIFEGNLPVDGVPTLVWWDKEQLYKSSDFDVNANSQKLLGQAEIKIGTGNGAHNAILAAKAINNKEIPPGGVFSFNETVGERTAEKGYLSARQIISTSKGYAYAEGIGGGICRTATALHKAVMAAGLQEVEQHSHSLQVNYEEDTAVAWGGWDYKFRNIFSSPVTIKCRQIDEKLVVELWQN